MPTPQVTVVDAAHATEVVDGMARVRADLGVAYGFPADVLAAADSAARAVDRTLARLRRSATALGMDWPPTGGYPAFVRSLDPTSPTGAALLVQATRALRGAGYVGFVGGVVPDDPVHGAVAAPYAHVTAPLRRLCDRATNEVVVSLLAGDTAPEWAVAELALLPEVMAEADSREGAFSRAALDLEVV